MKRFLFVICWSVFICQLGPVLHAQGRPPTILAYVDFPPYEYQENGQPTGILVDIVRTVFQRAGLPLELVHLPFNRAFEEVKAGRIDGLFNFYKTPERLQHFAYSEPLILNPLVLFVRNDSTLSFSGALDELAGLNIGAITGYTYGTEFDENPLFTIDHASSHALNFQKLLLGRIDAYPCDQLVGQYVLRAEGLHSHLTYLNAPLAIMEGHIGFTRGLHDKVLLKINPMIEQMRHSGEIDQVIADYLKAFNDL